MAEELKIASLDSRAVQYEELLPQLKALASGEPDLVANLANMVAAIRQTFGFFWVGFYRNLDHELVLGPFQGPLACTRIAFGRGVCGSSAERQETLIVPDVDQFPGHIACSSLSRSEIVVPLVAKGETQLILDVDSDQLDDFGPEDQRYLEQVMTLLEALHFS